MIRSLGRVPAVGVVVRLAAVVALATAALSGVMSSAVLSPAAFAASSQAQAAADGPSTVTIDGAPESFTYLVNGQPQVIKGMGLNTRYAQILSPADRAARLGADFANLQALGVNTVLGWDPAEFDAVLLDAAQRHGLGVVLPFDLNPNLDYANPSVRAELTARVEAWVNRYKGHPALRMWGLGNEVLFAIVEPEWTGHQDPAAVVRAQAFADFLVQTADDIHTLDPDHPVTYRMSEDAYFSWLVDALAQRGGGPRQWLAIGTNCYTNHLAEIIDRWPGRSPGLALWVSEFAPGTNTPADRPNGFRQMWGYIRQYPGRVLGGAVYAWTRNGPEDIDRIMGLTDDGQPFNPNLLSAIGDMFGGAWPGS